MGFLDKLFGKKTETKATTKPPKYPSRSINNDADLDALADFGRYYPLPEGYEYRERKPGDVVVARQSDGAEFTFLVEEGLLGFDIPFQRQDGSWSKKTTEVFKQSSADPQPQSTAAGADLSLGKNIVSDPDIKTFSDLGRFYPLPKGFEYQQTADGVPLVVRLSDGKTFNFLIEEELMSFDEPYTRASGKTGYKTTEVFKRR